MYLSADSVKRLKSAFGNKSICAMALFLIPNWRFLSSEVSESSSIFIFPQSEASESSSIFIFLSSEPSDCIFFVNYFYI